MKSLEIIQKIAKIFKILATIAFVCCIIGTVCCALGAGITLAIGENSELWQQIMDQSENSFDLNLARCSCLSGTFSCGIGIAVSWFAKKFFEDELVAGTPFDRYVCTKMRNLGIIYVASYFVSVIIAAIVYACFGLEYDGSDYGGLSTGLFLLGAWLLCRYGADVRNSAGVTPEKTNFGAGDGTRTDMKTETRTGENPEAKADENSDDLF